MTIPFLLFFLLFGSITVHSRHFIAGFPVIDCILNTCRRY
jgi:hypothetical protein